MATLDRVIAEFGVPKTNRVDNSSQLTSKEMDHCAYGHGVVLDFSKPGKPTDNAFIEAFNSGFRLEWLNQHWFRDIEDARIEIEMWRRDYSSVRPHGAIAYQVPVALMTLLGKDRLPDQRPDLRSQK